MKKNETFTIGLDLGGTKLAAALLDKNGQILDFIKVPVEMTRDKSATKTQKRVLQLMSGIVLDFHKRFPRETSPSVFRGVGLASAGPLNTEKGQLTYPVNYPGWKVVPIRDLLQNEIRSLGFNTPVYFQHDATAAALAEGWVGGGKGLKSYAVVTIGTGIGTGVILNEQPCQSKGMGSEYGHTIIDYKPLKKYSDQLHLCTVEGFASGTALLRRAKELGFKGASVEDLVLANEKKHQVIFDDMAWALACLCYNLSIGYNLERIFLSGGLIKIKALYLQNLKRHYKNLIQQMNPAFECPLAIAKTKNMAGVLGAGYLPYL